MATVDILSTQTLPAHPVFRELPATSLLVSEVWQDLIAIRFRPGVQPIVKHGPTLPEDFQYTQDVTLFIGTLSSASMHRDGQEHPWLSHPCAGKPVMWLMAQMQASGRTWFTNITGWVDAAALTGLLPPSLRMAGRDAGLNLDHAAKPQDPFIRGLITTGDNTSLAYELDTRGFTLADQKCGPLWLDAPVVTGSFSYAAAGRVRIQPQARLVAGRPGQLPGSLLVNAGPACPLVDLVHVNLVHGVTYMPGFTVITRHTPLCLSGEACTTRWTLTEPSAQSAQAQPGQPH